MARELRVAFLKSMRVVWNEGTIHEITRTKETRNDHETSFFFVSVRVTFVLFRGLILQSLVIRTAAAFRSNPVNNLIGVHDVTRFAVNAV